MSFPTPPQNPFDLEFHFTHCPVVDARPNPLISTSSASMYSYCNWVRTFFSESVTATVASIPGPKASLKILDASVTDLKMILPNPGPLEISFTCLSYNGLLRIAADLDTDAVQYPQELVSLVERHLSSYCDLEITSHVM